MRFYDKIRFKGYISNCRSGQNIKNLSSLHLEGCTLPIHFPPFRSIFFRQKFHQSNEASDCISKSNGDQIIIFLDDILIMANSHELAMQYTDVVIQVLTSLGFVINFPKFILIPSKVLSYLGFEVNSRSNETFLAKRKAFKSKTVYAGNHVLSSHCKLCSKFSRSL